MLDYEKVTVLPALTSDNIAAVMAERIAATKCENTVVPMLWQGLLELNIPVGNSVRTAKYYIPKDTPQGTTMVVLNIPEGEETIPFLKKSGWMELADQKQFCLFVLEPTGNGWGTPEEEEPYVFAAVKAENMGQYILASFAAYAVGYGSIGTLLHKVVMADPLHIAAAAFLDAANMDTEYLSEYQEKCYVVEDRYNPEEPGICVPYRDVPLPVWIASENMDAQTKAMTAYWKNADHVGLPAEDAHFGTLYTQCRPTQYTPEGNILKVAVQNQKYDYCSPETTDKIFRFVSQYYRYGMGPASHMVSKKVDYAAMGVEHRRFTDSNGIDREYLVYVPEAYCGTDKKLPTVLAYHGASQSMRMMMENGLWYEVADKEGLVIVYPESTLQPLPGELSGSAAFAYRPLWALFSDEAAKTDLVYANELLDQIIAQFPVDPNRIYCTGHSMGCMMTNFLGSSTVSHRLAAVGATSGCLRARDYSGTQIIPAFMTAGQFELWNYRIDADNEITDQIDMWLIRNGLATEGNVRQVRTSGATHIYKEGNYNHYVWCDAQGTALVRYAWVSEKHHVHTAQESRLFWGQWFSHWKIGPNSIRQYT